MKSLDSRLRGNDQCCDLCRADAGVVALAGEHESSLVVGERRRLVAESLGVDGEFEVVGVSDAPMQAGRGCPILGHVQRESEGVLEVTMLTEAANPDSATSQSLPQQDQLAVTLEHPFRSFDRNAWVPAFLLEEGERVVSGQGVAWVQHLSWNEERAVVHNLWVAGSHRYRVGAGEIEVHNECWLNKALTAMGQTRANIPAWMSNPHGHHIIPVNLNRAASARVREIAAKLQDLAQQHGLDIRNDPRNLAVSPNGMGTHSVEGLQAVYDALVQARGNKAAFLQGLQDIRETMWLGDFYRQLGRLN